MPAGFDGDPASLPRLETNVKLESSLIIFEQLAMRRHKTCSTLEADLKTKKSYFSKTIAIRGDLDMQYVRETERDLREEMLNLVEG